MAGYDACIIGVGAAGAIIARELTEAGMEVIALERGPYWRREDFRNHDEVEHVVRGRLLQSMDDTPYTFRRSAGERAVLLAHQNRGTGTGGATTIYSAWMWRLLPEDFRSRTSALERYGEAAIPADCSLVDWPLSYEDLEPWYDRAEVELGICGEAGVLRNPAVPGGVSLTGRGNPFEGPRSAEFPLPPLPAHGAGRLFEAAARSRGYHPYAPSSGILSQRYQDRGPCALCGTCTLFGCHVDAKAATNVTHLPAALATGRLTLRTGCTVYRLRTARSGRRVEWIDFFNEAGERESVSASLVILAAFTFEIPRLLLLSASDRFPRGLANSSGQVGRNQMGFGGVRTIALYDGIEVPNWVGPLACHRNMDDLNGDNFDHSGLGFLRGANIGSTNITGGLPYAFMHTPPPDVGRWGSAFKDYMRRYYRSHLVINAVCETLPYPANRVDLDPVVKDRWGLPAARITFDYGDNERRLAAFVAERCREVAERTEPRPVRIFASPAPPSARTNALGTARMGNDPATSVVDSYGRCHDVPNLFVAGAAVFPTSGSKVPTLTIAALALRTAAHILAS